MTTKTKTIKGWANNSKLLFSPNTTNNLFISNLKDYISKNLKGYKKLNFYDTLRGKNATKKVIIKGYYWRGSWSDPTKETVAIFYK